MCVCVYLFLLLLLQENHVILFIAEIIAISILLMSWLSGLQTKISTQEMGYTATYICCGAEQQRLEIMYTLCMKLHKSDSIMLITDI